MIGKIYPFRFRGPIFILLLGGLQSDLDGWPQGEELAINKQPIYSHCNVLGWGVAFDYIVRRLPVAPEITLKPGR
jgi:hypothetical protein